MSIGPNLSDVDTYIPAGHSVSTSVSASIGRTSPRSLGKDTAGSRYKSKPCHPFITGNKKNYDQFANSLSRDLLTNAFLQVGAIA